MDEAATSRVSLDELILRHQQLLGRNAKGEATREEREAMVADLIGAGTHIPSGSERDALRNMLYFWIAEQSSRDGRPLSGDLPTLTDYQAQSERAGDASQPPRSGAPHGDPGGAASETRARSILRLAALGRQWRLSKDQGVKDGYLLTGMALEEAKLYRAEDPDIEAIVLASEKQRDHSRIVFRSVAIAALLVLIAGVTYLWLKAERANELLSESRTKALSNEQAAREAESAMSAAKQALEAQVAEAVQALAHDDLSRLKQFLKQSGDIDSAQIDRLRLSANTPQGYQSDALKAPAQRRIASGPAQSASSDPATAPPNPAATSSPTPSADRGLDACSGFVWLGAADDSHVVGQPSPLDIRAGTKITLDTRSDYRLRSRAPDARYAMGTQLGIVPGGATIEVASAPVSLTPPAPGAKAQIWASVSVPATYCTTVYIQYTGNSRAILASVTSALGEISVQTPQPEMLASAKGLAEVRYYFPSDENVAGLVARQLAPFNHGAPLKLVLLANFQSKPKARTIEVWLDLSE